MLPVQIGDRVVVRSSRRSLLGRPSLSSSLSRSLAPDSDEFVPSPVAAANPLPSLPLAQLRWSLSTAVSYPSPLRFSSFTRAIDSRPEIRDAAAERNKGRLESLAGCRCHWRSACQSLFAIRRGPNQQSLNINTLFDLATPAPSRPEPRTAVHASPGSYILSPSLILLSRFPRAYFSPLFFRLLSSSPSPAPHSRPSSSLACLPAPARLSSRLVRTTRAKILGLLLDEYDRSHQLWLPSPPHYLVTIRHARCHAPIIGPRELNGACSPPCTQDYSTPRHGLRRRPRPLPTQPSARPKDVHRQPHPLRTRHTPCHVLQ